MRHIIVLSLFSLFSIFSVKGQVLPEDRQIDWKSAGLRDTTTANFTIINLADHNINGDGITPNDDALSLVLESVASEIGAIINFPEGNFLFNNSIPLSANTIISGQGADRTILTFDLGGAGHSINVVGNIVSTEMALVTSAGQKNENFLEVNDASNFQSGDWIQLNQLDTQLVTSSWAEGTVGQIMEIESIAANKIFLKSSLRKNYLLEDFPTITKLDPIENVGISCLKIVRVDDTAPSQTSNVRFVYATNCWVSSVESFNCTFSHIEARYSANLTIEKSYLHDAFGFGGGGRAYGVMLHFMSNEILVENNIFRRLRHSMILQAGANGNVLAFNYSTDPFWSSFPSNAAGDMVLHGNYIFSNLFEQNIVQNIVIDNSHGPNGPNNTFLRNRGELFGIFFSATNSPGQNFIGNEITNTNSPYSFVNYNILGTDHFTFGNNNKGNIDPAGTTTLADESYFYDDVPTFVEPEQWSSIGIPNTLNQGSIPAIERFQDNDPFLNTCGQITTSVEFVDNSKDLAKVFPNPFSDIITFESEYTIHKVEIYSIHGTRLRSRQSVENTINLNLSTLPAGIYNSMIYLENNKTINKRLIKI